MGQVPLFILIHLIFRCAVEVLFKEINFTLSKKRFSFIGSNEKYFVLFDDHTRQSGCKKRFENAFSQQTYFYEYSVVMFFTVVLKKRVSMSVTATYASNLNHSARFNI